MIIAFIGFGNMGVPIAVNLLKAGFTIHAYNRTPKKLEHLKSFDKLTVFDRPESAVKDADVLITMLSDDAAVKEVTDKVISCMKRGSLHLSMSTIAPTTATALKSKGEQHGVGYVACPVLGRPPAAENKMLFILLSGPTEQKARVDSILRAISQRIFDYGSEVESAHLVKLMINYQIMITVGMLSEVMLTAEKTGIDKKNLLETMTSTIFGSPAVKTYGTLIVEEKDIPNGVSVRLASKDLRLIQEVAGANNFKLPLAEVVQSYFREIIDKNEGDRDVFTVIQLLRSKI